MRAIVKMVWCEGKKEWHMCHGINGKFIQELYDCENTEKFFPGLDKKKPQKYVMTINRVGNGTIRHDV